MAAAVAGSEIVYTATSFTPAFDYPASIAAGDIILLNFASTVQGDAGTVSTPAGYTQLGATVANTFDFRRAVFWKVADGSETGSSTITQSTDHNALVMAVRITGGSGIDVYDVDNTSVTGATADSPSVITTANDELVICFINQYADGGNAWGVTVPGSTTIVPGDGSLQQNFHAGVAAAYFTQASLGATGAKTWTGLHNNTNNIQTSTIAITSAGGGGGSTGLAWVRA